MNLQHQLGPWVLEGKCRDVYGTCVEHVWGERAFFGVPTPVSLGSGLDCHGLGLRQNRGTLHGGAAFGFP